MVGSLILLFFIFTITTGYTLYNFKNSRNKKIFFSEGVNKAFLWSVILFLCGFAFYYILPKTPLDLSFIKFHSEDISTYQDFKGQNNLKYYLFISLSIFTEINLLGLFSALLILGIWFYYIRRLDFFETENMLTTITALLLGMFVTFFTFPLSDFIHQVFNIEYSQNSFYNLFVYSFLGIGVVEELIKLIPVLYILYFTKEIDEPFDLIYYACISALGFAFIENLLYLRDINGSIVLGRTLLAAVGHMIDSTIVVYGILLYKFKFGNSKGYLIPTFFILGAFVHGLYDYFLFAQLLILFLVFFIFIVQLWAIMINNAINNSKYFDYTIMFRHNRIKFRLAMFIVGIIIINYVLNGLVVGGAAATREYISSLAWGSLLLIFYVSNMSSLDLFKGYWRPIRLALVSPSDQSLPGARGFSIFRSLFKENLITPMNYVGKRIKIHAPPYNRDLIEVFHVGEGTIIDRIKLKAQENKREFEDIDWFLVDIEPSLNINDEYERNRIIIKIRNKHSSLKHDEHIQCWLKLIPKGMDTTIDNKSAHYLTYGYIIINGEDYQFKI